MPHDDDFDYYNNDPHQVPNRSLSTLSSTEFVQSPTSDAHHVNKDDILKDLALKQFPLESGELVFRSFDQIQDERHFAVSYRNAVPTDGVVETAWAPTVSIVFMPGLDIISVAQAEQQGMTQEEPKPKSPRWRVLTAGTFLSTVEFDDNLALRQTDCTPQLVADMHRRLSAADSTHHYGGSSLFRLGREDRIVTIDSDNVKLVNKFVPNSTDLEATLIEVDKSSLFSLVIDFRSMIRDGGVAMLTDVENRLKLLEVMIEDARRLAIRSPILFRASTRQVIARSRNTRYGVDHGTQFETITTSVGIKNIISKSSACYNTLAAVGGNNKDEQALIRPKFLQILVLLLSLLNDTDLQSLATFLWSTYQIKAERAHIELLILKVLPLQSINSKIFVREIASAVNGPPRTPTDTEEQVWNDFIASLVGLKYVLPGFTQQMGQRDKSWLVKFPRGDGIKDSFIFNNLQYLEEDVRINHIPSIDLAVHPDNGMVTTVLADGKRYLIPAADHQKITGMIFGTYSIVEATPQKRTCDITISEAFVNDYLNQAIRKANNLVGIVNTYFADLKSLVPFRKSKRPPRYPDIIGCGRLTWHEAKLNGKHVAVAYKVEGKKIARWDMIRNLVTDIRQVQTTIHHIEAEIQRHRGRRMLEKTKTTIHSLESGIPEVRKCLAYAEENRKRIENAYLDFGDEIVRQTIYPSTSTVTKISYWSPYQMRLVDQYHLRVEARYRQVTTVNWVSDDIVEIGLIDPNAHRSSPKQFFVSPLQPIAVNQRQWEIRQGDELLILGQYIVIVKAKPEREVELPTHHSPRPQQAYAYQAYSRNAATGRRSTSDPIQIPRRPVLTSRPPPQRFLNWMKIVEVPQGDIDPREINEQDDEDEFANFAIH